MTISAAPERNVLKIRVARPRCTTDSIFRAGLTAREPYRRAPNPRSRRRYQARIGRAHTPAQSLSFTQVVWLSLVDRHCAHVTIQAMKRTACLAAMFTLGTVCHPFHGRSAHACGATPLEVNPLLPLDATIGAGLDIVLISSSNLTEATFALLEVGPAGQGAEPNAGMPWPPPNGDAGVASIDGDAGSVNASDPPSSPLDAGSPLTATDTRVVDAGASEPIVNTDEAPQPVEFETECFAATRGGGAVCIARPLALLKPNTRYEWAVVAHSTLNHPRALTMT